MMKEGNEHIGNIIHRLIKSTRKTSQQDEEVLLTSPVQKFKYQLPSSFFEVVDKARLEDGYDVLPHFHNLSVSPSTSHITSTSSSVHQLKKHRRHHHTKQQTSDSSSTTDNEKSSSKRIRLHQKLRQYSHRHKTLDESSSNSSLLQSPRSTISRSQSSITRAWSSI